MTQLKFKVFFDSGLTLEPFQIISYFSSEKCLNYGWAKAFYKELQSLFKFTYLILSFKDVGRIFILDHCEEKSIFNKDVLKEYMTTLKLCYLIVPKIVKLLNLLRLKWYTKKIIFVFSLRILFCFKNMFRNQLNCFIK